MLLFQLFIGIVLCIALSWLFSFVIVLEKPILSIENIVTRMILGALTLVVIVSLMATKGNTILILAIPILIIAAYANYKNSIFNLNKAFQVKDLMAVILFFSVALLLAYLNIYGNEYLGMKVPVNDQAFYTTTASGLIETSTESTIAYLAPYYKYKSLNVPYHYFEYWLTYVVENLTHFNTHLILNGIVYGFCIFCSFLAFYNILRIWLTRNTFITIVCSIVLINVRGLFHYTNLNSEDFVQGVERCLVTKH